ncbi:HIT-like domain-containing protein, partial [Gaertneriomyces semiglobifer]
LMRRFGQDDEFIAFNDISPSAKDHFLVIPRQHIETIYSLNSSHISLVTRMRDIGHHLLDQRAYSLFDRRLGFHVPPFTSVPHIHLHVMGLPWKNSYRAIKYPDSWAWARWWIGIEHVVESLKVAEERDEEGRWKWSWVNHK